MKMSNNVITYYWTKDGQPERLRDHYCWQLFKRGIIKAHDIWTIENSQGEVCGAFYHISGPKVLVDFLSWLTDVHFGKGNKVNVQTDETGQISQVKEL